MDVSDKKGQSYDAFLSYSHADIGVAEALQRGLHRVGRRVGQLRALRVYRDATDLAANPGFWAKLEEAIQSSRYLVAVLSPAAAGSEWVNREIETWISERGSDHVLIALVEGSLVWDSERNRFDPELSNAAPDALLQRDVFAAEPLFVDLTGFSSAELADIQQGPFRSKVVDIAAPIHGKSKDQLDGEDRKELRRFRRYRRAAVAGLVALTVASVVTSFLAVGQRNEARRQTANARARELAALAISEDDPDRALALAVEAEFATETPVVLARTAFATAVNRYLQLPATAAGPPWQKHVGGVNDVAWSPDGSRAVTVGSDSGVVIWSADGAVLLDFASEDENGQSYESVDWSPDGSTIVVGDDRGEATLFDSASGNPIASFALSDEVVDSVEWSPDGSAFAVGIRSGAIHLVTPADGSSAVLLDAESGDEASKHDVAWSADGTRLLSAGASVDLAFILDPDGGVAPLELVTEVGAVRALDWSPDGRTVAIGGSGGTIELFDARSGEFTSSLSLEGDWIDTVSYSPDGAIIASGGHDSQVRLFDADSGQQIGGSLTSHRGWINSIAWSPDGERLLTASTDRTIRQWETDGSLGPFELLAHQDSVLGLRWSPSGQSLVSGSSDMSSLVWNMSRLAPSGGSMSHDAEVGAVAWSIDEQRVVSGDDAGTLVVWEASTGRELFRTDAHDDAIFDLDWSATSDLIASASTDGTVAVLDGRDGQRIATISPDGGNGLTSVSWAPDGENLALAGDDGVVNLWSRGTNRVDSELWLDDRDLVVNSVAWSPGGRLLAAGYSDSTIRIWDVDNDARPFRTLFGHDAGVLSVSWSPTDGLLVSGSEDASVRIWDVDAGRQLGPALTHPDWKADVVRVAWAPDGERIATAFNTGGIQIWEGLTETDACRMALRALGDEALTNLAEDISGSPICLTPTDAIDLISLPVAPIR